MSLKKVLLSTVAAATVVTTVSANMPVSAEQTGNYLVFPKVYGMNASGNWSTTFRVVNSNETAAIVAKVVIRAQEDSAELLDFPIYLTPGDVFEGKISQDPTTSEIKFSTTDDSFLTLDGVPASTTAVSTQLHNVKQSTDATKADYRDGTRTYIEVFEIAKDKALDLNASWVVKTALPKYDMQENFRTNTDVQTWDESFDGEAATDLYGLEVISASDTGSERSMTLMATAFRKDEVNVRAGMNDWNIANGTGPNGENGSVIRGSNTKPSAVWGTGLSHGAISDLVVVNDLRAALEKTDVFVDYSSNGAAENQLHMTIPMKKLYVAEVLGDTANVTDPNSYYKYVDENTTTEDDANAKLFNINTNYCYYYEKTVRNMSENTYVKTQTGGDFSGGPQGDPAKRFESCVELKSIDVLSEANPENYTSGMATITYYGNDDIASTGDTTQAMPIIPTAMTGVKVNGVGITNIYYPAFRK